jgi:hypothetical protein
VALRSRCGQFREGTMDIIYIGLTLGFFALSWTLIKLCERV